MEQDIQTPFDEILAIIFSEELNSPGHLYRLSDMNDAEFAQFLLNWNTASDEKRRIIVRYLADISEENFVVDFSPIFRMSFGDPYAPVRIAALEGLWDSTDPSLVDPILNLLISDSISEVRETAARSLSHFLMMSEWDQIKRLNTAHIIGVLKSTYEDSATTLPLKCAVLEAMGPVSSPEIAALIEDAYEGYIPELQLSAIFAMGTSADPRWVSILINEMESPHEDMRAEAARAVGIIGDSSTIPHLKELAFDEDSDVAIVAVISIAQIGGDEAENFLDELLNDPQVAHLHDAIEEALEEADWLGGDLPLLQWSEDDIEP